MALLCIHFSTAATWPDERFKMVAMSSDFVLVGDSKGARQWVVLGGFFPVATYP